MLTPTNPREAPASIKQRLPAVVVAYMTPKVVSVSPTTPLREVLTKMEKQRISCIIVCSELKPVGIVTERDLLKLLRVDLDSATAADLMTSPLLTVHAQDSLDDAVLVAQTRRIRHFPVVNDFGALVGIVTQTDLLRAQSER